MRGWLTALLLLAGSLETHAGGAHHFSGAPERWLAPAAEHPAAAAHLEASNSLRERSCPTCASLGRGLAVLGTPLGRPATRLRIHSPAAPAREFAPQPLLLPAPPRGPPAV